MCNLYSMTRNREAILRLFRVSHDRAAAFEPFNAVFPGWTAPVIRKAEDGERELNMLSWGFVLPQNGKAPRRVTNVRDDKVLTSRFWRDSFEARRCLVPASSFCEPHAGVRPATWHWFALKGEEPRPLFAFAGLWRPGEGGPFMAFLTCEANKVVGAILPKAMPVMLRPAQATEWLDGTSQNACALAIPFDDADMRIIDAA